MFPKTFVDKVECLESLVGVRTTCSVEDQHPFWIEDIEGVDVKKLASMAKATNPSGRDFANQLINNAARQMMGNIELLLNNGYKMQNIIGDVCSNCTLLPVYTANAGITIKNILSSRYSIMRITRLNVLANITDTKQITIDDGIEPKYYSVSLEAGVLMPVNLNYSTMEKSVNIYFTDITVPVGQISCPTSSSCGCGGSPTSNTPIKVSGILGGLPSSTQYGFVPCVKIGCSYDSLVCNLISQAPNIFGLAMMYKVGELYYDNKNVADRNNDAVSFNDDPVQEYKKNYAGRYWTTIKGGGGMSGINHIINDYLKTYRADKCVICEAKVKTAYATG